MAKKRDWILIAEDESTNIDILESLLGDVYDIKVALDGTQALKRAMTLPYPDLILLDVLMPGLDGFQVCEKLKADPRTRHIPVIFISSQTETEHILRGFEVGGVDYVRKPFNAAELRARVKTHIEVKILRGLIPICASCKNLRNDRGMWERVEAYFEKNADVLFSHSICPDCIETLYGREMAEKLRQDD